MQGVGAGSDNEGGTMRRIARTIARLAIVLAELVIAFEDPRARWAMAVLAGVTLALGIASWWEGVAGPRGVRRWAPFLVDLATIVFVASWLLRDLRTTPMLVVGAAAFDAVVEDDPVATPLVIGVGTVVFALRVGFAASVGFVQAHPARLTGALAGALAIVCLWCLLHEQHAAGVRQGASHQPEELVTREHATDLDADPPDGSDREHVLASQFTRRELEILALLLREASYAEIASALWISQSTVRAHTTRIMRKLGVHSRDELLERARRAQRADATLAEALRSSGVRAARSVRDAERL